MPGVRGNMLCWQKKVFMLPLAPAEERILNQQDFSVTQTEILWFLLKLQPTRNTQVLNLKQTQCSSKHDKNKPQASAPPLRISAHQLWGVSGEALRGDSVPPVIDRVCSQHHDRALQTPPCSTGQGSWGCPARHWHSPAARPNPSFPFPNDNPHSILAHTDQCGPTWTSVLPKVWNKLFCMHYQNSHTSGVVWEPRGSDRAFLRIYFKIFSYRMSDFWERASATTNCFFQNYYVSMSHTMRRGEKKGKSKQAWVTLCRFVRLLPGVLLGELPTEVFKSFAPINRLC